MKTWKEPSSRCLWCLGALLVAVAAFGVYARTLGHGFVWDDHLLIEKNPFVQDWGNARLLFSREFYAHVPSVKAMNQARPVWLLSSLLDHKWWGLFPAGWHLTNTLLHALNSVLFFILAWLLAKSFSRTSRAEGGMGRSFGFALLAGLLFAVHPIQTEAVSVISFRADLLCAFFVFASLILYVLAFSTVSRLRAAEQNVLLAQARRFVVPLILIVFSLTAFVFGILSKEMAVSLPLILILIDSATAVASGRIFPWKRLPVYAAYLACLPAYVFFHEVRFSYQNGANAISDFMTRIVGWITLATKAGAEETGRIMASPTASLGTILGMDPLANVSTMGVVFVRYLRLLVAPFGLTADHPVTFYAHPWAPVAFLSLFILGTVLLFAFWMRKTQPFVWFATMVFFLFMLPVANIIPVYNLMAERYLYLPSISFCLLAGWGFSWWRMRVAHTGTFLRILPVCAAGTLIGVFALMTIVHTGVWRDDKTLWQATARQEPSSARAWYQLGYMAQQDGRVDEAIAHYRRVLVSNPTHVEAKANLALLLESRGTAADALANYQTLLVQQPASFVPYMNAGNLLLNQKKWEEAIAVYNELQLRFPDDDALPRDEVNLSIAKAYAMLGKRDDSEKYFNRVTPGKMFYAAHAEVGRAMEQLRQPDEAERHYRRVLIDVEDPRVMADLGVLLHHQGRIEEALQILQRAAQMKPAWAGLRYNLGTAYSDAADLEKAQESLEEAVRLDKNFGDAWYNLAVVYQRQGRLDPAIRAYERVVKITPKRVEALSNLGGCYELLGDLEKAEGYSRRAISVDPTRSAPYVNLGNVQKKRGQIPEAIASYQEGLRCDPRDVLSYNNLGVCYLAMGEVDKANRQFVTAIRTNPQFAESYYHLGVIFQNQGRLKEAAAAWNKVLSLNPNHQAALRALAGLNPQ